MANCNRAAKDRFFRVVRHQGLGRRPFGLAAAVLLMLVPRGHLGLYHPGRAFWLLTTALLIAGCARLPVAPEAADFQVEGKVGIVAEGRSFSARFNWRQTGANYDIRLWGLLGQGRTHLRGDANHLEIDGTDGEPVLAGHPSTVMRQRLGWSLPLAVLPWWMSGRPAPEGLVEDAETDGEGRLTAFRQLGWQVRYSRFKAGEERPTPNRIDAERPGYRIRVSILNR